MREISRFVLPQPPSGFCWERSHILPFSVKTPVTLNGKFLILIVLPIGFILPNSSFFTVWPMTATLFADRSSCFVMNSPDSNSHSLISK